MALGILDIDTRGKIIDCNPAAERMFGWSRDELLGQPVTILIAKDSQPELRRIWSSLVNQRQVLRVTGNNVRRDGTQIFCEWNLTPLVDFAGQTLAVACLVQDLTEHRAAQELIENQRLQMVAASKMSSLGEMAAGIAHEINNPLAIIFGRTEQLQNLIDRGEFNLSKIKSIVGNISSTADRIARIVAGLRFFARDGAGDQFEFKPLAQLIDETLAFCQSRFQHHQVRFDVDYPPAEVAIECRAVQISQVLLNLFNNAFDAVHLLEDRWVQLTWRDLGPQIEIRVTDSGRGIPPEIASRMMTPFFTTKEVGKGTGLGLSISRGIVESHNGRLEFDTGAKHTSFVITLPKFQRAQNAMPMTETQVSVQL